MDIRHYLIGGVALAAVVATLVYVLSPATITGDREADAACAALAEHLGADGTEDEAVMRRMAGAQLDEVVDTVTGHTEHSTIESIRDAGRELKTAAAEQGLLAPIGVLTGVLGVAGACQGAGWTVQKGSITPGAGR